MLNHIRSRQATILEQHFTTVEHNQRARTQQSASSSSAAPKTEEQKNWLTQYWEFQMPRPQHGIPTESRTDPHWWERQPADFIKAQVSNMGWRKPALKHFTPAGKIFHKIN